ncbi:CDP-diacylglycerol--glycerol-3-phosphate 3-phosphatidyltransferase [hydrothermal vent metagenome]|uniref:CDP-diacylglycerol--glycerol-3-phosphate 3-phosphatidyltransferase n=1 Tax=hydrothermal vent metagenome TaxID=652676 RepID=A0A3B0U8L9_9ZZZZ
MSLPNILTLIRIGLIPVIIIALLIDDALARWTAIALFAIAAITDYLDGYFARKFNIISSLGRMLDPIADKLLVGALLIALAYNGSFTLPLLGAAIAIMMREIAVAGLREFLGGQQIVVNVTPVAKYKTTSQLIALGAIMLVPLVNGLAPFAAALMWLATALTVYSGYDYFASAWPHLKEKS